MLNLKAQVGQVGYFVSKVCRRDISHLKWLIKESMCIEITIGKLPHLPHLLRGGAVEQETPERLAASSRLSGQTAQACVGGLAASIIPLP
jgi:hypothetical protein